jgi:hypothetical protein
LALLPVWKANPTADFSGVVDTPQLFEFIEQIRAADRVWTVPFDTAQDVVKALRAQLAYEVGRGLECSRRLRETPAELAGLSGKALRLAIDKPRGWQALLIAELLDRELASADDVRRNYQHGVASGSGELITQRQIADWISANVDEASRLIDQFSSVVINVLNEASHNSDIPALKYGARTVASVYYSAIEWSHRIRRAHVPDDWRRAILALSEYLGSSIKTIETLPNQLREEIQRLATVSGDATGKVHMRFEIEEAVQQRYLSEMKVLRRKHGLS